MRIYVADDCLSELRTIRALLARKRLVLVEGGAERPGWRDDLERETSGCDALIAPVRTAVETHLSLIRAVRRTRPNLPVLVLAPDKRNLAEFYRAGIDDHVVQPVDGVELVCRLEALVRRAHGLPSPEVRTGALVVPLDGQMPSLGGRPLELEHRLLGTLICLARQAGRVVSRETLHAALYDDRREIGTDTIKVHICRLRARLARVGGDGTMIETVPDRGYRLRLDPVRDDGRSDVMLGRRAAVA